MLVVAATSVVDTTGETLFSYSSFPELCDEVAVAALGVPTSTSLCVSNFSIVRKGPEIS